MQETGGQATFIGIGASNPTGHHTPTFDIDEESLPIGVSVTRSIMNSDDADEAFLIDSISHSTTLSVVAFLAGQFQYLCFGESPAVVERNQSYPDSHYSTRYRCDTISPAGSDHEPVCASAQRGTARVEVFIEDKQGAVQKEECPRTRRHRPC